MRLRGTEVSVLKEEGLDSEGAVTSKSKLQSKVKALSGVDILTATGEYKSTYEILRDIADVWKSMNDMDQAALLELISGKRNSSVIAAILQNPTELKAAFEDANNASGSALKENEKYLNSIQGKIDQFNNAVQSFWSNVLDSDVVKGIVEWGTKIVKSLDTTQGKLMAIVKVVAILMAYKKVNPLEWVKDISTWMYTVKDGGGIIQYIKSLMGLAPVMKVVTAETVANTIATQTNNIADQQAILQKIGLAGATGTLNNATKETIANNIAKLVTDKAMTVQMGQQTAAMLGYTLSVDAAGKATVAADVATKSFMASNPIGWILLIVSAVMALVTWVSQLPSKIEKLTEELKDLQADLRDVQSEIESVNSELETTNDRISELLSKDKLSFVEKEELKALQKRNEELQREIDLLELKEKQTKRDTADKFVKTMDADVNTDNGFGTEYKSENGKIRKVKWYDWVFDFENTYYALSQFRVSENDYIQQQIERYQALQKEIATKEQEILQTNGTDAKSERQRSKLEKEMQELKDESSDIEAYINGKTTEWGEWSADLNYGINDETDSWLDYINNVRDRWAITSGGQNATTNTINRIFSKDKYSAISGYIDEYVEALKNGDESAKAKIDDIIRNNSDLVADLKASGIEINNTINEAADYFTSFASESNYATIEGKIKEIDEATKRLNSTLGNIDISSIDTIKQALTDKGWVDTEGNLMSDAIAEYFGGEDGGISEKTRAEIERLVKQIYDGKITIEDALKQFEYFGVESTLDIYVTEIQTNFKDVFTELEEVDGLIDTFEELGEAISSTTNALNVFNKAEAEMANSGRVSIETALQLMEYTDDYGSVLEVVDGRLQLVDNAEEVLIQTRIDAIKTSAEASLAEAKAAYQKAKDAVTTYNTALTTDMSAEVVASAWQKVLAAGSGLKAGIEALFSGGSWTDAYNSAYNTALSDMTGYETSYNDTGLQALIEAQTEAEAAMNEAQDRVNLANQLTSETLKSIHDADDVDSIDEVQDDAFQREMDYWENRIAANQAKYEQIQNEIDLLETKGQKASVEFYEEQIQLENERKWLLEQQKEEAQAFIDTLEEGSEEWWKVANTLNDIEGELDDVTSSILDLQDAIAEIDTYIFDEFNARLDNLTSKLETIRNLIAPDGEEDWFDDEGSWSDAGIAVAGTYLQELETYKQRYQNTIDELAKYKSDYAGNEDYYEALGIHSEQEWYDKTEELISQQYDFAESISDTEQSIVDMYESSIDAVEEYVDTLIDGYNDYIDSVKEALEAERDLYDFKKNVQKQAKDISELERRIASLSGSTNKADIAERRKLEAQLYESRESLNDTYYDHAKDVQNEALDAEQQAYETAMTSMVEKMRVSLEEATTYIASFLDSVTIAVSMNADTVLEKYRETEVPLNDAITNPWEEAAEKVAKYGGDANNLMDVWKKDGYFAEFKVTAGSNLSSPWSTGAAAATSFKNSVSTVMNGIANSVRSNVSSITSYLGSVQSAYNDIISTAQRASAEVAAANAAVSSGSSYSGSAATTQSAATTPSHVDDRILSKYKLTASQVLDLGYGPISLEEFERLLKNYQIKYSSLYKQVANTRDIERLSKKVMYGEYVSGPLAVRQYAKGTTDINKDQFAIVDELGPELILRANPETGRLDYITAGTGIIPADLTENLMEWGQFTPDAMNLGGGVNVNMINNAVNKPEFNFAFDALVKAENITEETLPAVKKLVTQELNRFTKELNYALKGKGAR